MHEREREREKEMETEKKDLSQVQNKALTIPAVSVMTTDNGLCCGDKNTYQLLTRVSPLIVRVTVL